MLSGRLYSRFIETTWKILRTMVNSIVGDLQLAEMEGLFSGGLCPRVTYFRTPDDCRAFSHGCVNEGLIVLTSDFLQNLNTLYRLYEETKHRDGFMRGIVNSPVLYEMSNILCNE
eukprot:TRINITY_DN13991_c0_g1_i3.p3 TRINITY_DN13991_c0_g1~~TRINITY_DN13991_c0_g1_i3.p3  ORF type:complete len:115 (-),score=21.20 TRINITY_DN13991_c0_g1_i3:1287-1631(-)